MPNRFWRPDDDAPRLYEWWEPLHRFAALARSEQVVWSVHPEHFDFSGRIERPGRSTVHIFEHRVTLLALPIDREGVPFRRSRGGSFLRGATISATLWRAGVPQLQMGENQPVPDEADEASRQDQDRRLINEVEPVDHFMGDIEREPEQRLRAVATRRGPALPVQTTKVRSGLRLLIVE